MARNPASKLANITAANVLVSTRVLLVYDVGQKARWWRAWGQR
jgi:hypothetical protein